MKFTIIKVQTGKTIIPIKFKLKCIYQFIKNIKLYNLITFGKTILKYWKIVYLEDLYFNRREINGDKSTLLKVWDEYKYTR
ncbi:hypothetical protein GCM10008917_16540 [Paraclostridium tenue]|uniref:Uncharacterized protein n=1 Tax=Paraclostridium tenue TaxID=1737 RepID=A0ABN1M4G7_9FIRM